MRARAILFVMAPLLAIAIGVPLVRANDSTAELATGGLLLTKTADIEMRAEDLYISAEEIRVNYKFFNKTPQVKVVTVAFPMPDIVGTAPNENISLPTENPENVLDFSTLVDGHPVTSRVEQRVFAKGVDRTEILRGLGVPLQPQLEAAGKSLDALPQAQRSQLIKLGLAEIGDYGADEGPKKHLIPRWTLKTTYYWEQAFPVGRELLVEHRYKPSVGRSAVTSLASPDSKKEGWYKVYLRKYCIDRHFLAGIENARKAENTDFPAIQEQRIAYVLRTGANWAAPIKAFRLVVDKGDAKNLVSFCGDAVRISPTQFEVKSSDYAPTDDVNVLILTKTQQ